MPNREGHHKFVGIETIQVQWHVSSGTGQNLVLRSGWHFESCRRFQRVASRRRSAAGGGVSADSSRLLLSGINSRAIIESPREFPWPIFSPSGGSNDLPPESLAESMPSGNRWKNNGFGKNHANFSFHLCDLPTRANGFFIIFLKRRP